MYRIGYVAVHYNVSGNNFKEGSPKATYEDAEVDISLEFKKEEDYDLPKSSYAQIEKRYIRE